MVNGTRIALLGDPHLGRRFVNGVPMHRRGDRENMVAAAFKASFKQIDGAAHICMGDIFDRPVVPPHIVALAADTYKDAIARHPGVTFILLRGNHDATRDMEGVTSFDLLRRIIEPLGVVVVHEFADTILLHDGPSLGVCPWSPSNTSTEIAEGLDRCDAAFGHWDVVNPSSDTNLVPRNLKTGIIVTGHDHKPRQVDNVLVVGSMQPFSNGEDPEGIMYRTVTLAELEAISDTSQLCLRVVLKEGETLPDDLDALQIQVMHEGEEASDHMEVGFQGLDMEATWRDVMAEHGVQGELSVTLFNRYRNRG